jgi:hypothetical protein
MASIRVRFSFQEEDFPKSNLNTADHVKMLKKLVFSQKMCISAEREHEQPSLDSELPWIWRKGEPLLRSLTTQEQFALRKILLLRGIQG